MKITIKSNFEYVKFYETRYGDVLFFENTDAWGDEPFIRIDDLTEVQCIDCVHEGYYVLNLRKFDVWEVKADERVRVANAELIITNKENQL